MARTSGKAKTIILPKNRYILSGKQKSCQKTRVRIAQNLTHSFWTKNRHFWPFDNGKYTWTWFFKHGKHIILENLKIGFFVFLLRRRIKFYYSFFRPKKNIFSISPRSPALQNLKNIFSIFQRRVTFSGKSSTKWNWRKIIQKRYSTTSRINSTSPKNTKIKTQFWNIKNIGFYAFLARGTIFFTNNIFVSAHG